MFLPYLFPLVTDLPDSAWQVCCLFPEDHRPAPTLEFSLQGHFSLFTCHIHGSIYNAVILFGIIHYLDIIQIFSLHIPKSS